MTDPTTTPPLTPRQNAAPRPLETPAGADADRAVRTPATGRQAGTEHFAGRNAEDCPACRSTNPPYPFICPGDDRYADTERVKRYAAAFEELIRLLSHPGPTLTRPAGGVTMQDLARTAIRMSEAEQREAVSEAGKYQFLWRATAERADSLAAENARLRRELDRLREKPASADAEIAHQELANQRETFEDAWRQQAAENTRLRDERDRARDIAVALEQQLAALPGLLERSYPHDYAAQTIVEHLRGEVAWPAELNPQEEP